MIRGGKDSISMCMLYNSVNDMSKTLGASLAEVMKAVRETTEEGKQHTSEQIVSEVGKIRSDLSMTHNRVTTIDTQTSGTEVQVAHLHEQMTALSAVVADVVENVGRLRSGTNADSLPDQRSPEETASTDVGGGGEGEYVAGAEREASPVAEHAGTEELASAKESGAEELRPWAGEARGGGGDAGDDAVAAGDCDGEGPDRSEHGALMLHAAGISSVNLICHRDSWQFVVGNASGHKHFCEPWEVCDHGKGRVKVMLSGRSLIAVLIALRKVRVAHMGELDGSWALAATLYRRIQDSLYRANPAGADPLTIILDDGVIEEDVET